MKIENLIKANLPTGKPITLERMKQVKQVSKILLDENLPIAIRNEFTAGNNMLAEIAGLEAIRETGKGNNVVSPTAEEMSVLSDKAQQAWAVAAALKVSGTAELSDLRKLTDKLGGFALIPFKALNPKSLEVESEQIQKAVKNFDQWATSVGLTTWVLAPIHQYDVCAHALSGGIGVPYAGVDVRTHMQTIQMNMPLYVEMIGRTDVLDVRVTGLETRMNRQEKITKQHSEKLEEHNRRLESVERISKAQSEALASLKNELEAESRARLIAQQQAEQRAQELRSARWQNEDPLIIAINGTNISGEGKAIMGPCWGPDIDQIVIEARKLEVITEARRPGSSALWAAIA